MAAKERLKSRILKLLKEDEEFRYAVAGLIGLDEILKRLDRNEQEIARLREDMIKGFERHDRELAQLREDMMKGFERHEERFLRIEEEIRRIWQEIERLREETNKLREDMIKGFERHDRELAQLREDMIRGFERHDRELERLREDMMRGFDLVNRHISALGARWGLMSEEAFREGLRGILEKELGLRVERWTAYDESGEVFGYPSRVEVDVAVKDGRTLLIEVSSHVRPSDVAAFVRKAEFYERKTGISPDRLIMVTPYAEERAVEAALRRGVELYTKV